MCVCRNGRSVYRDGLPRVHHVVPYAESGEATVSNIELRCRAHNGYEAERHFGTLFVREARSIFGTYELGPDLVRQRAVQDCFEQTGAFCLR